MLCGKTNVPVGSRVRIVANSEGNMCEPFLGLTGTATTPFPRGHKGIGWIGVMLDEETIYGRKANFHIDEIIFIDNEGNEI